MLRRLVEEADGEGNTYRQATIFEIQRNRTVIDFAGRHVAVPMYELGDHRLPQGFTIMISLLQLHSDPNVYRDPERFDPQRFLDDKPSMTSWVPFGGGTPLRGCGVRQHGVGRGAANGVAALDHSGPPTPPARSGTAAGWRSPRRRAAG